MQADTEKRRIDSFEDLLVWQKGIELVKQIYLETSEGKLGKDYGLREQLRRASVSIPTNIAEGFERNSRKEYLNFLNIAKASAGEVRSLLRVSLEVGFLDESRHNELRNSILELSRYLSNPMKSLRSANP